MEIKVPGDADIIVLDAFRTDLEPKLRIVKSATCWCTLVMNVKERTVRCSRCDKVYEPFEALVFLTTSWTRYAANRDAIKHDAERLRKKRDELREEVKNLKAQRKRLKEP